MTKKGPLGKAEIFYVKGHYEEQEVEQIAKDLDRALSLIRKQIAKLLKEGQPKKKPMAGEAMARREGIVVMTETASELGDQSRGRAKNRPKHCTTKIKND